MGSTTKISRVASETRANYRSFGASETARWFALKLVNRIVPTRYIVGMTLEKASLESLKLDPRFQSGLMKPQQLARFVGAPGSGDPGFGLSYEGLAHAERNGVECYAIIDGGERLASLGWYSCEPIVNDGNPVYFDPGWAYMFRGYTDPDYRGFRLHGVGMARAMLEFQKRGLKGLISDVDGRNLSSLKSVFRLGYKRIGALCIFQVFGKELIWADAGCRQYGFRYAATVGLPSCTALVRKAPTSGSG